MLSNLRAKICRKEAKESMLWSRLLIDTNPGKFRDKSEQLLGEATQLKKIFSLIIEKSK